MRSAAAAVLLLVVAAPAMGRAPAESPYQVWKVGDRRWTAEEEARFGAWVDENITEDFFLRYRIPTDCADVPYAARWIYSRIAHLPAAATTNDGTLVGNWSTDWRHLPTGREWYEDSRFRAALLYVLSKTTTRTLPLDTYPTRIDRESVIPGTVFLISESHSGLVGHVSLDGSLANPLETWESTLPVKVRQVKLRSFLMPRPDAANRSGLLKFRWVTWDGERWSYCPAEEHPFYSEEQYASSFRDGYGNYVEAVAKRIDPVEYDPWEQMTKVIGTLTRSLRERVPIVLAGYEKCRSGGCSEGSDLWEVYGTPSRDGMIVLLVNHLNQIIESNHFDQGIVQAMMEGIPIEISKGRSVTLLHVYRNCLWLSPDPQDSIEMRWGLKKCEMILARSRAITSSIAFIEKTYRKRDPKYADFAAGQQRDVLQKLTEEWNRSQCAK